MPLVKVLSNVERFAVADAKRRKTATTNLVGNLSALVFVCVCCLRFPFFGALDGNIQLSRQHGMCEYNWALIFDLHITPVKFQDPPSIACIRLNCYSPSWQPLAAIRARRKGMCLASRAAHGAMCVSISSMLSLVTACTKMH